MKILKNIYYELRRIRDYLYTISNSLEEIEKVVRNLHRQEKLKSVSGVVSTEQAIRECLKVPTLIDL